MKNQENLDLNQHCCCSFSHYQLEKEKVTSYVKTIINDIKKPNYSQVSRQHQHILQKINEIVNNIQPIKKKSFITNKFYLTEIEYLHLCELICVASEMSSFLIQHSKMEERVLSPAIYWQVGIKRLRGFLKRTIL